MSHFLTLRGRNALSAFRVAKLLTALAADRPAHAIIGLSASFWHFVACERELAPAETATLERILTYGPHDDIAAETGSLVLVVPRPGTISPWSSKATDIARNCGLSAVTRIERGVGYRIATRGGGRLAGGDRAALAPLLHDRMTEAVLADLDEATALLAHVAPRSRRPTPSSDWRSRRTRSTISTRTTRASRATRPTSS